MPFSSSVAGADDVLWRTSLLLSSLILCHGQDIRPQLRAKHRFCPGLHFGLASWCRQVPPRCLGPPGYRAGAQPTTPGGRVNCILKPGPRGGAHLLCPELSELRVGARSGCPSGGAATLTPRHAVSQGEGLDQQCRAPRSIPASPQHV